MDAITFGHKAAKPTSLSTGIHVQPTRAEGGRRGGYLRQYLLHHEILLFVVIHAGVYVTLNEGVQYVEETCA